MKKILISFFICFIAATSGAGNNCPFLFIHSDIERTVFELADLRLSLDVAKAENKTSLARVALENQYLKKEKELTRHFSNSKEARFLIESAIQEIQRNSQKDLSQRTERNRQDNEIKRRIPDGKVAYFNRIEPGKFVRVIPKPYDFMKIPVTQIIWARVAKIANSRFPGKYDFEENPSDVINELAPVNRVSYVDVTRWIEALNELSKENEPMLFDIMEGQTLEAVYRLPTDLEWGFVFQARGSIKTRFVWGDDREGGSKYGNDINRPSGLGGPGPDFQVAQKLPIEFENMEFYDMVGNVCEWTPDPYEGAVGQNVVRGGFIYDFRGMAPRDTKWNNVGFRLVRVVKTP